MTLKDNIMNGAIEKVVSAFPDLPADQVGPLFLYAVTFEQEEIAFAFLEQQEDHIDQKTLSEAFISAAAHGEASLISKILNHCPKKIPKETLLAALRMAVAKSYDKVLAALAKDKRLEDIVNTEDKTHPHIIMLATDQGDHWLLERVLKIPGIRVLFHHLAYADRRKKFEISELLKLQMTKQHFEEVHEQKIWQYEIDQCQIGPHLAAELEKRKRSISKERLK